MTNKDSMQQLKALAMAPDSPDHFRDVTIMLLETIDQYNKKQQPEGGTIVSIGLSVLISCILLELTKTKNFTSVQLESLLCDIHATLHEALFDSMHFNLKD